MGETLDTAGRHGRRPGGTGVAALSVFWLAAALLAGTVGHVSAPGASVTWTGAVLPFLVASLLWVLLTLLIVRGAVRYPPVTVDDGVSPHTRNALLHGVASLGVSFVLNAGILVVLQPRALLSPDELLTSIWSAGLGHLHLNAGVYWVITLAAITLPVVRNRIHRSTSGEDDEQTLTVRSGYSTVRVRVSEIRWIEGAGDYVRLHLPDTEHLLSERLKRLEDRLDPSRFVRVHRSAIVNVSAVRRLRHLGHGDYEARLDDGSTVRVARTRRARLAEVLEAREVP